jgi:hypothetical protein
MPAVAYRAVFGNAYLGIVEEVGAGVTALESGRWRALREVAASVEYHARPSRRGIT